jgi:hypothetical protein
MWCLRQLLKEALTGIDVTDGIGSIANGVTEEGPVNDGFTVNRRQQNLYFTEPSTAEQTSRSL